VNAAQTFPVAVVIVGAGAGTRFGEPKATALLPDGRRFLDAVAETAIAASLSPIVAVLPPGTAAPAGVRVVTNAKPKGEQIESVRLGLSVLSNSPAVGALLWPVDFPFVTLESVLAVLDCARRLGAPIVLPTFNAHRGHPAFFAREVWRELMTVPDGGARAVVRSIPYRVAEVEVRDRSVLRDIDTPNQLTE
jgi:CTP:molybdopterin cytidylyltransferase MocA